MDSTFLELIDLKKWQVIQNYFAGVIGATIRVVDPRGTPLTSLSQPHRYCFEVISSSSCALDVCKQCLLFSPEICSKDPLLVAKENFLDNPNNVYYDCCPFFAHRVIVPIRLSSKDICAYIVIGPLILGRRRTYFEYFNLAQQLILDITNVIDAVEQIKIFSFQSIQSTISLMQEVANYLVQAGAQKTEYVAGSSQSKPITLDGQTFSFYANKILQAFFDTTAKQLGAERASIMLRDEGTDTLSIRISSGIPDHVIQSTRLILGQGLAGWAAQKDKVLFVDNHSVSDRLSSRLHQPKLRASLIVPLKRGDKVFGVLNLSTEEKDHKFTKDNNKFVVQLGKFVNTFLQDFELAETR
ncbi:MAG: GAF domain-containing protein [PVC group bacterium]|nr:GAF domain-containing protein [PVC group bacterium]